MGQMHHFPTPTRPDTRSDQAWGSRPRTGGDPAAQVPCSARRDSGMAPAPLPRSRRRPLLVAVALLATLTLLTGCLAPGQQSVLDEMNADRRANGYSSLAIQADAQAKAQAWAERLARENRLYHSKLSDGIRTKWCSLGENVGYGPSVAAVQDGYMKSPATEPTS